MSSDPKEPKKQEFSFQAEVKQLLDILAHSLYQSKEIAVRELVSNASDALDRMRHLALTDQRYRDDAPLEITVQPDQDQGALAVCDNGIGMTRQDLIDNLPRQVAAYQIGRPLANDGDRSPPRLADIPADRPPPFAV